MKIFWKNAVWELKKKKKATTILTIKLLLCIVQQSVAKAIFLNLSPKVAKLLPFLPLMRTRKMNTVIKVTVLKLKFLIKERKKMQ